MSRFNSLEFGNEFDGDVEPQQILKDEQFYMSEATLAFASASFEHALRYFAKVLEFNPKNTKAWAGQVQALIELGEFPEAKLWADKALEQFPNEAELLAAKAVALGRSGDLQAAMAFSDASIEERGDTPYVWLARGDVLLARAEKRADYCFAKALAISPGDWFTRWMASRINYFYEKFSIALKFAQEALTLNVGHAAVWLQLGECQLALGLINPAENSFTQARQIDPRCSMAEKGLLKISNTGFISRVGSSLRQLFQKP